MHKKILLFFFVGSLLSANAFSQIQLKYGLKAGIQQSGIPEIHSTSSRKIGVAFGAFAMMPLNEKGNFNIQAELLYSMQGEYGKKSDNSGDRIDFGQGYLAIPVLFKANLFDFHSKRNFFVELGPQFSFLANQKSKELDEKEYGKAESFDLAVTLGAGYRLDGHYELGVRYNMGLTDVYKTVSGFNNTRVARAYLAYIF